MQAQATPTYPELRARSGVLVVDGYGIALKVHRGRLVISDGIGRERRERVLSRSARDVRRIVLLGHTGYVTLEAIRWMTDIGIGFIHLDTDGRLVATSTSLGNDDPRLRRAQALAATNGTGVEMACYLIGTKLDGQIRNVRALPAGAAFAGSLDGFRSALDRARTLRQIRQLESSAALAYFQALTGTEIRFAPRDLPRIPHEWRTFGRRSSPLTGGPRSSADPINSMLNYLFALLEAECRFACLTVGLDPGLGVVHADLRARDSFALDLMETVRPDVEAWLVRALSRRTFRAADFHETRQGICRVLPPLTHLLAETIPLWRHAVAPVAERVVRILAGDAGMKKVATHLTQANRSSGRERMRVTKRRPIQVDAPLRRSCERCGEPAAGDRKLCDECYVVFREEHAQRLTVAGPDALTRLRASGVDPVRREAVRRVIGEKVGRRNRELAAWRREHGDGPSPDVFKREVLPMIASVPTAELARESGLSRNYVATIKAGKHVPHARHWSVLLLAAQELKGH